MKNPMAEAVISEALAISQLTWISPVSPSSNKLKPINANTACDSASRPTSAITPAPA
ncbi:hypothetical protein D3C83_317540 [compost metagenome]